MPDQDALDRALGLPSGGGGGSDTSSLDAALGVSGEPEQPSALRRYGALAVRGGLTAGGALLGSLLGPFGTVGGGGLGAGLGEYLGQKIEGRKDINPYEVAGSAALGAIPLGGELTLGKAALKSGLVGAGDTVMRQQAEQGLHVPTADEASQAIGSGALSAATGGLLHKVLGMFRGSTPTVEPTVAPSAPAAADRGPVPFEPTDWANREPAATVPSGPITRLDQVLGIDPQRLIGEPGAPSVNPPPAVTNRFGAFPKPLRDIMDAATANEDAVERGSDPLGLPTHDTAGTPHFEAGPPPTVEQQSLDLSGSTDQPDIVNVNGSGTAGGGSLEEINRTKEMQRLGQNFVVFDKAGNKRVIGNLGGTQDYFPRAGETTAIEGPNGELQIRDDNGGRVPVTARLPQPLQKILRPSAYETPANLEEHETFDLGSTGETTPGETTTDDILNMASETPHELPVTGPPSASPAIKALWEKLMPKWIADREHWSMATGTPYEPNEPSLADFEKNLREEPDPNELMGGERKIRKQIDSGELGAASTRLLLPLAGGGVGSIAGSFANPEHPLKGAVEGGILGAGLPLALQNPALANKFRYFSLLSSPVTILKKAAGDASSALTGAYEKALTGDTATAKRMLGSFFSPQTVQDAIEHFKAGGVVNPDRTFGSDTSGIMGIPSRLLGAITEAAQGAHTRAGLSPAEAERLTFTGPATTRAGRGLLKFQNEGGPLVDAVMPFARVATNLAERGSEYTPGLGMISPLLRAMKDEPVTGSEWGTAAGKQALGLLALLYGANKTPGPTSGTSAGDRLFHAGLGPLMIPEEIGEAMAAATRAKRSGSNDVINAAVKSFADNLPLPHLPDDLYPSQLLSQLVPTGLTALSQTKPSDFDQDSHNDPFGPAIARIPILNDLLLRARPHPPTVVR